LVAARVASPLAEQEHKADAGICRRGPHEPVTNGNIGTYALDQRTDVLMSQNVTQGGSEITECWYDPDGWRIGTRIVLKRDDAIFEEGNLPDSPGIGESDCQVLDAHIR